MSKQPDPYFLRLPSSALLVLVVSLASSACTKFASEYDIAGGNDPSTSTPGLLAADTDGDWSCLSEDAGNNPLMNPNGPPLDYAIQAVDFISGQAPRNLSVRACYRPDLACARPATAALAPDAGGVVTVPLSEGFDGYLELRSDEMVPTLLMFPAPLTPELAQSVASVPVALLPFAALQAFGEASQLALDPAAGVVSMNALDCLGPAAGVRLELNAAAVPFSFIDGLPIAYQDTTTDEGSAGFANVLPGLVVVRGFLAGTSELVGLQTVLVRTGWVSVGHLMPQFAATN